MKSHSIIDEAFEQIVAGTAAALAASGFVRQGPVLRKLGTGNSAVIEFQKSTKSSKDAILFTVNLALVCGALLEPEQPAVEKTKSIDGHLRQRIGALLPGRPDKWWEITTATNVGTLVSEISGLILNEAAPYIVQFLDTNELVKLWEAEKSPGLTKVQRMKYLESLVSKGG